jgi:hypothetical protein
MTRSIRLAVYPLVVLAVAFGGGSMFVGRPRKPDEASVAAIPMSFAVSPQASIRANPHTMQHSVGGRVRPGSAEALPDSAEQRIDAVALSEQEQDLLAALGGSAAGLRITRLVIAGNHHEELTDTEALQLKYVAELQRDPFGTLEAVETALGLPALDHPTMAPARASLVVLVSQVPGLSEETEAMARQELTRNPVPAGPELDPDAPDEERMRAYATTPEMALPIIVHRVLLSLLDSASEAIAATLEGIAAQPNATVRRALVASLLARFPEVDDEALDAALAQ